MTAANLPVLDAAGLRTLAEAARGAPACAACGPVNGKPGWEAVPGTFDAASLRAVGTLRHPDDEDPTLEEYHPAGTHAWSPDAPVSVRHHPYNRCEVWECGACARVFLRYTEYGGYYHEQRIRPVDPALVVVD
ncbi:MULTISPECIES: hypothetical protein [unclassified Ramlibacter]|uniref:hypothetical protein n=1 Tax=unclassified Ramlibacter TaxID=2617605 RepID=UPI00363D79D1